MDHNIPPVVDWGEEGDEADNGGLDHHGRVPAAGSAHVPQMIF